ncbi:MAG TPA: AAA family ATPase [Blastocatellia bacterium]|nr:AAA family ATPase [Blastocatellia bacterium]
MSRIIVFCGPPLSGKSTLAALYGAETGVPVMEMDLIRQRLMPDSQQSKQDRDIAYGCMHFTAEQLLRHGIPEVALVATYTRRDIRRALIETVAQCETQLYVLQFRVSVEAAAKRFAARATGHAAVDLTAQSVRAQAADYPYDDAAPILDTTGPSIADTLSMVAQSLDLNNSLQALDRWVKLAS